MSLSQLYVNFMHGLRVILRSVGALSWLEKCENRRARWLRSLLAIYDLDDLIQLKLPWWTFDAVEAIDEILVKKQNARVFEWGSGSSTLWLAARAKEVVSVEHDGAWAREVQAHLDASSEGSKVSLSHVGPQTDGHIRSKKRGFEGQFFDNYVAAILDTQGKFDLIVIDGRAREACLTMAVARLAPGGRILLDDFRRKRYREAVNSSGLSVETKDGLAVCLPFPDSTALLSRAT